MTAPDADSPAVSRRAIRVAQLLLVVAALGLWVASRMTWVVVTSFDHLSPPRTIVLSGATWSTAMTPLALLLLATAVACLAVRGWALRLLALLVALVSAGMAYLAIGIWVLRDVGPRAVELAEISVTSLADAERRYGGAVVTLVAAVVTLVAAVLMMRTATRGGTTSDKYARPTVRRAETTRNEPEETSERTLWDALDDGVDPTDADSEASRADEAGPDTKGR